MNADVFSEWLRRQGHHVLRTASSYWYDEGPGFYQAFPYHWTIEPSRDELDELFRGHRVLGLRYSTPLAAPIGKISYHVVYERPTYTLDDMDESARRNVRRGLQNCSVGPIAWARLAEEGWALQADTLERQGRGQALSRERWQALCLAAADLPGFEAWGAEADGRLAASIITFQMEDWACVLYAQCLREHLQARVNNALSFHMTSTLLGRPAVHGVFYGLHSLDAPASVDEFKFRMGHVPRPVRQRVVFHPWLAPLFGPASHALVRYLLDLRPGQRTLAKAEGMIRFYLEGKRPPQEQSLPEALQGPGFSEGDEGGGKAGV